MPHIILEMSANVLEKEVVQGFFSRYHDLLAKHLPAELGGFRSRAIEHATYHVGDGDPKNAFVHMSLKIMTGRTPETLTHVGGLMMDILKEDFSTSLQTLNLHISLEISELTATYFKVFQKNT